jgi:hypothetical protein
MKQNEAKEQSKMKCKKLSKRNKAKRGKKRYFDVK